MSNKHEFPMSTSLQSCDYNDETKEMHITFCSGGTHKFHDVDKETYEGLKSAKSPGSYFHANIRRSYKSSKVD